MVEGIRGEGYNFAEICGKAQEACEKRFVTGATEAKLEDTDWVWEAGGKQRAIILYGRALYTRRVDFALVVFPWAFLPRACPV